MFLQNELHMALNRLWVASDVFQPTIPINSSLRPKPCIIVWVFLLDYTLMLGKIEDKKRRGKRG